MEVPAKKENVCAQMDLQAAHVKEIYKVTTLTQTQVNLTYQTWVKRDICHSEHLLPFLLILNVQAMNNWDTLEFQVEDMA